MQKEKKKSASFFFISEFGRHSGKGYTKESKSLIFRWTLPLTLRLCWNGWDPFSLHYKWKSFLFKNKIGAFLLIEKYWIRNWLICFQSYSQCICEIKQHLVILVRNGINIFFFLFFFFSSFHTKNCITNSSWLTQFTNSTNLV